MAIYVYESSDKGMTVYRREIGSYDRELVQKDGIPFIIDPETEIELKGIMEKYAKNSNN